MDDIVVWGIFYWRSKPGFRATVKLANREVVWLRCGLWRTRKICWSTYNLGPSPPAIALKHLISLPFTRLFLTLKLKDKLRELVQLCFIKMNGQRKYEYLVLGRDISYFIKHHSDSTKKFSEMDILNMLEFLIAIIFSRQSACLWVQTVPLFSPTCSFNFMSFCTFLLAIVFSVLRRYTD